MKLKLEMLDRRAFGSKVFVDDVSFASICTGVTVAVQAGQTPTATLELVPFALDIVSEAEIYVKVGDKKYRLIECQGGSPHGD